MNSTTVQQDGESKAMRFHSHHGSNIQLDPEMTVASRKSSFANALTFSNRPLAPGEIFLIEIEENESGWSGHMRIGLTQKSPNTEFDLPLYALPDLLPIGPSWAYAITETRNRIQEPPEPSDDINVDGGAGVENGGADAAVEMQDMGAVEQNLFNYRRFPRVIHREGCMIRTPRGLVHENKLLPYGGKGLENDPRGKNLLPTDVGSRIGVMYVPTAEKTANMHFIINGEDQGPCSREIPYKDAPLFAVVDVYGSTKRVRMVQIDGVESLQSLCRDVILKSIKLSGVSALPIPRLLKKYLMYA